MKIKTLSILVLSAATLAFSVPSYSYTPKAMDSSAEIATQVTELKEQVYEIEGTLQILSAELRKVLSENLGLIFYDYNEFKHKFKEKAEREAIAKREKAEREARAKREREEKEANLELCIKEGRQPVAECIKLLG